MPKISALTAATAPDADDLLYIVEDGNSRKATIDQVVKAATSATGAAPIYACRAWVNFNGTGTVAIRASGNVSSITDNGTGDYTVNFATAMPDANYSVLPVSGRGAGDILSNVINVTDFPSTTSFRLLIRLGRSIADPIDQAAVYVAVFR